MPEASIGARRYPTKAAREEAVRDVLRRYDPGDDVSQEEDDLLLRDPLDMHPKAADKIGPGVAHFRIVKTPRGNHRGPQGVHINGDGAAFSYELCDIRSPRVVRGMNPRPCPSALCPWTAPRTRGDGLTARVGRR